MDHSVKNETLKRIDQLENLSVNDERISGSIAFQAVGLLERILSPLLAEEQYSVSADDSRIDTGLDLIAERIADEQYKSCSIGVTQKHYAMNSSVGAEAVYNTFDELSRYGFDRGMVVINTRFSAEARQAAQHTAGSALELMDIQGLRAWLARIDIDSDLDKLGITQIWQAVNNRLVQLIIQDPRTLDHLEWRDVERLVRDIFDGIGFDAELTPGSKDGGKDVILSCTVAGEQRSYIVEIKHWRSRQRVGGAAVKDFLNVLVREKRDGGIFLSTYGYANNAFESLTEVDRATLRHGDEEKIVALCKTYQKLQSGIWSPPRQLTDILYADTN
ncbi:UNVERIFIED_CONTAM: hypothetical protein GTU68_046173 [Idotea baltica]|nr:hypothetical protein [Idotea baltica]